MVNELRLLNLFPGANRSEKVKPLCHIRTLSDASNSGERWTRASLVNAIVFPIFCAVVWNFVRQIIIHLYVHKQKLDRCAQMQNRH